MTKHTDTNCDRVLTKGKQAVCLYKTLVFMIEPIPFFMEGFNVQIHLLCPDPGTGRGLCVAKHAIMSLTGALYYFFNPH